MPLTFTQLNQTLRLYLGYISVFLVFALCIYLQICIFVYMYVVRPRTSHIQGNFLPPKVMSAARPIDSLLKDYHNMVLLWLPCFGEILLIQMRRCKSWGEHTECLCPPPTRCTSYIGTSWLHFLSLKFSLSSCVIIVLFIVSLEFTCRQTSIVWVSLL